ncbi:hypothetical protein JQN58_11970 [Aneurinibacillus sp. BA2021]|uniref:hypothetical protein n=1 Tax=Acinetobacter baumannii TaxID=470 RepID=UPI000B14076C|nr:hypothetical protein [Acinetobacter baumannii]MBN6187635.1 hypothetical protein [Aneurinibacillus sp. BA2021]
MEKRNNRELEILGTHQAAITDSFETIETARPQRIDPPKTGPGVYDERQTDDEQAE